LSNFKSTSTLISKRLMCNNGKMPSEFNRQPRVLSELCYWKATELRQFLLYHGPIILKGVVSDAIYKHFLALHVAMSILLQEGIQTRKEFVLFARDLLLWFVSHCKSIHGNYFTVYNIHLLIHITDDVLYYNCSLNDLSAFKFENFMQTVKKLIRNSKNPLVQILKRLSEREKAT